MEQAKKQLANHLGNRLGLDDGAEDVLDMLLTIESNEDLLDYLQQLLGTLQDFKPFVEDLMRFKQGQLPLSLPTPEAANHKDHPPVAVTATPKETTKLTSVSKTGGNPKIATGKKEKKGPKNQTKTKKNAAGIAKKKPPPPSQPTPPAPHQPPANTPKSAAPPLDKPQAVKTAVGPPPRGTPSRVCGCFGSLHRPLQNCLYCGRIACEREGLDFCAFCGYLVTPATETGNSDAWRHKEQLLQYDRESAQRTVVIDDQADYYDSHSNWLTEEERAVAVEQEQLHDNAAHKRQHLQLNLGSSSS